MNATIEKLEPEDSEAFIALLGVFERVFEMERFEKPEIEYLQDLLQDEHFHAFVALVNDNVVGGLTAYTLKQYYLKRPLAYIYDLAVETHLQRQGIGQKLMDFCIRHFKSLHYEEVFVQADRPDDYALDFYRKTKPTGEEDVVHFTYQL